RVVERTFVHEAHRPLNGRERAFPGRREGRRLGPAAQARPISRGLRSSGGREILDILAVCVARRTDWPTVDAGRAHAGEKPAVIGCVAADPSSLAFLEIEHWRLLKRRRLIIRGQSLLPASFPPTRSDFGEFTAPVQRRYARR